MTNFKLIVEKKAIGEEHLVTLLDLNDIYL